MDLNDTQRKLISILIACANSGSKNGILGYGSCVEHLCFSEDVYCDVMELAKKQYVHDIICNSGDDKRILNKVTKMRRIFACSGAFEKLDRENIRYAVLKGVHFAKQAYGDIGYRKSNDVDILIDRKNIKKALSIFKEEGFVQGSVDSEGVIEECGREKQMFLMLHSHQTYPMVKCLKNPRMSVVVDFNFELFWGEKNQEAGSEKDVTGDGKPAAENKIFIDEFLEDAVLTRIGKARFKVLPKEKAMMQICLHHYKDMNSIWLLYRGCPILKLLCDIYFFAVNCFDGSDVTRFSDMVLRYSAEKYVYYIFYYTYKLFCGGSISKGGVLKEDTNGNNAFKNDFLTGTLERLQNTITGGFEFLDEFGLQEDEKRKWNVRFDERIFNESNDFFIRLLNESDMKKIEENKRYMM